MIYAMKLRIELEREIDGRWIAEIRDLPGVLAYGNTREEVFSSIQALAFLVLADRLRNRRLPGEILAIEFYT
jgi:predicted RNase H-like HicB family nuclease